LLNEFYNGILIPPAVVRELDEGKALGVDLPNIDALPWIKIQAPERLDRVLGADDLGAGEREVLAFGVELMDAVAILDDRLARSCAESSNVSFTGTLGILLRAKAEKLIPRIEPVLVQLEKPNFRFSTKTRAAILHLAGE
jgi:uncharacterized protein